ncbi:nuclear transport factor 2 family protein [Nocardioides houyundeii]|uniref:nuclear transport factor 2 family protein n=1 Tax=Nocardioides houyundeii TaxID=2045452 RepID=UPI000DF203A4|nr:nuclear transport factor 2 family protein [Nocardioides houyundeii]
MSTQDLLDQYFDSVNNHKWDQLSELFHPDVTIQHGMSLSTTGRDRAVRLLTAVVGQFATHEDIPVRTLVDGNVAAIEIKFEGTKPDGTALEFDAVDFIDTDGTHITKVVSWYDTAVVLPMIKG